MAMEYMCAAPRATLFTRVLRVTYAFLPALTDGGSCERFAEVPQLRFKSIQPSRRQLGRLGDYDFPRIDNRPILNGWLLMLDRPSVLRSAALYLLLPSVGVLFTCGFLSGGPNFSPSEGPAAKAATHLFGWSMVVYCFAKYFCGVFLCRMEYDGKNIKYWNPSPNILYYPQMGLRGSVVVSETRLILFSGLGLVVTGNSEGIVIPTPVGWKRRGEWLPPLIEACLANEGQMNYRLIKKLEDGKWFPPMPELAERVRAYLDAAEGDWRDIRVLAD